MPKVISQIREICDEDDIKLLLTKVHKWCDMLSPMMCAYSISLSSIDLELWVPPFLG